MPDRKLFPLGKPPGLSRRAALLAPVAALGGCSLFDSWFGETKTPLPGTRLAVMSDSRGLQVDPGTPRKVTLPPAVANADWPQPGGDPAHGMGRPACAGDTSRSWNADIGVGGGYRRKITAQPVVVDGRVFTMDSDAVVSAFDVANGGRVWRAETQAEDDRSTNVGAGIATDAGSVYAATGRADLLALEVATGKIRWRIKLPTAARSAPTIADGRVYVSTLDDQLLALAVDDGKRLWAQQATNAETRVLGLGAPAFSDGIVVAGFGSGELLALRAGSGVVAWGDSLAAARGRNSLADISTIRGMPAIKDGRVYAIGVGGLMVALDLRSGRRLWERDVGSSETPWIAGDWIYIVSQDARVAAISREDGAVAWITQLDQFENMEKHKDPIRWIGPVLAGDRVVLAGTNSSLVGLDPVTGAILGTQDLSDRGSVSPVVAGGTLYVITDNATITALR